MIRVKVRGDYKKANHYMERLLELFKKGSLDRYGIMGVEALSSATPMDSGVTASSWVYEIIRSKNAVSLVWKNNNINNGVNIAVILQYGHGTGTGGYVQGVDYINPALKPVFDKIAKDIQMEVRRL